MTDNGWKYTRSRELRKLLGHHRIRHLNAPAAPDDPFRFRAGLTIYVAGALFSEAERAWLDGLAAGLRGEGFECFLPHEHSAS